MKLTENEPKERTFTLELSETELRVLHAAMQMADFGVAGSVAGVTRDVAAECFDNFCDSVRLLGVS